MVAEIVQDTRFSIHRGFFDQPFALEISTGTAGATIRYTLDGSAPSDTTGLIYSQPLRIERTTIVRAMAFQTGASPWRCR